MNVSGLELPPAPWRKVPACAALIVALAWLPRAQALDLTGVLLDATAARGEPAGAVWRTSLGRRARPIGFTRWPPPGVRGIRFGNRYDGNISIPLLPGVHIATLFWQFDEGAFPARLVLNLFFNGDNENPGISAVIPSARGLTQLHVNWAATTLSLYLDEVENTAGLFFDGEVLRARLGAAFYFPSAGPTAQWRPADFANLDRVGAGDLVPDGLPDGVLIFELKVAASPHRRRSPPRRPAEGTHAPPPPLPQIVPAPALERQAERPRAPTPPTAAVTVSRVGTRTHAEGEEKIPATLTPEKTPSPEVKAEPEETVPEAPVTPVPGGTGTAQVVTRTPAATTSLGPEDTPVEATSSPRPRTPAAGETKAMQGGVKQEAEEKTLLERIVRWLRRMLLASHVT